MANLAIAQNFSDLREMAQSRQIRRGQFQRDAAAVLTQVKKAVSEIIATLRVHRPVDLKDLLELDATLSWQLFKIATEKNVLAAGAAVPSRASIEKFANAAVTKGAGQRQADALFKAYTRFETVVERHAGDRTTFISLATSAAGISSDWLAADLQHRRHMYRGLSHAMGVQARTRLVCQIIGNEPVPSADGYRFAFLSGYVNMRTLRQIQKVRVYGSMIIAASDDPETRLLQRRPIDLPGENALLEQFCSEPLPELVLESGNQDRYQWASMSMISPEVGNVGVKTVMFGEEFCSPTPPEACQQRTNIPSEELLIDVLAPPGRLVSEPTVELFLGETTSVIQSTDRMPLLGEYKIERLGIGPDVLSAPEMPRYAEMVRAVADKMQFPVDTYEVWRFRVEYPMYHSTAAVAWKIAPGRPTTAVSLKTK